MAAFSLLLLNISIILITSPPFYLLVYVDCTIDNRSALVFDAETGQTIESFDLGKEKFGNVSFELLFVMDFVLKDIRMVWLFVPPKKVRTD